MATIVQVTTETDILEVGDLLREYTAWVLPLTPVGDAAPTFHELEAELATLPGPYSPPAGCLLLARHEGRAAGCIALRGHDRDVAELKRLYVRPAFRGYNIGAALVGELVARATALGYRRLVLDSHISMTKAHALYTAAGFHKVDTPADFPDELKPVVVFMEMRLRRGDGGRAKPR
jgi:GNAT superfamily N-acetyltransferase